MFGDHKHIKQLVESVGREILSPSDFNSMFDSAITADRYTPRYRLKAKKRKEGEPDEIANTNLKVRIYTPFFQMGETTNEIGIPGRFMFDLYKERGNNGPLYLSNSLRGGLQYGLKTKQVIEKINDPVIGEIFIDPPHLVTVLNWERLPEAKKEEKLISFVKKYFLFVKSEFKDFKDEKIL